MRYHTLGHLLLCLFFIQAAAVAQQTDRLSVTIEWSKGKPMGTLKAVHASIRKLSIIRGKGKATHHDFKFSQCPCALKIDFDSANVGVGSEPAIIQVASAENPFSFLLRDALAITPIYIPAYHVAVFSAHRSYTYNTIAVEIAAKNLKTKLTIIEQEPEASFEAVSRYVRKQTAPTWLGLGRDIRHFQVTETANNTGGEVNVIEPLNAAEPVRIRNREMPYSYAVGRGQSPVQKIDRSLENGFLPILHTTLTDDDVVYKSTQFVTLEKSPLQAVAVKGTHFLIADKHSYGNMLTPAHEAMLNAARKEHDSLAEETVLFFRTVIQNTGAVPRYAWIKTIRPGRGWWDKVAYTYERATGHSGYTPDSVFAISLLDGKPLPNEEMAVLLQPGDSTTFDFFLTHKPVSKTRAAALAKRSFVEAHQQCREFWESKLAGATVIDVPERRIANMLKAGLFHLDQVTYGNEPDGTLAPAIGVYSPIGTESSPIIQFYNSMGKSDWAKRSLQYFLDKQHDDGLMQNFGGYMVETGAVLWSAGEYFRYTRDTAWIRDSKPKLLRSCEYLLKWRARNKVPRLKESGYGLIDGKVADPEDHFHQFMLNAYAYLGISRMAETLQEIDPPAASRLHQEANAWRQDIRTALFGSMSHSPVVPLGDGTWCPTAPPWTETAGPRALYLAPEKYFSHGTFMVPDALLGPLYLVFCEVLDPNEEASKMLLAYHSELFYQHNAALSQPYYSRHGWVQLKRGMVKPFLQTYYTTLAALADRQTFTFWEHLYHVSVHKTHEEAWFLMQTRWMLFREEGDTLRLLGGIPRAWLEDGKSINVTNAATYFGKVSFTVKSDVSNNTITATSECQENRRPGTVLIRMPHPDGRHPVSVEGGLYDPKTESVRIDNFSGQTKVTLRY